MSTTHTTKQADRFTTSALRWVVTAFALMSAVIIAVALRLPKAPAQG